MADALRLKVAGWEDLTSPQDATTPSSAPGNEPPTANGPPVNEPEPSAKRRRLSLSLNRPTRFEFLDEAREEALSKKFVPKNTEKSTQWALSTFLTWRDKRNECYKLYVLSCISVSVLNFSLIPQACWSACWM